MTREQLRALRILVPFTISLMAFWFIETEEESQKAEVTLDQKVSQTTIKGQSRGPASVPQVDTKVLTPNTVSAISSPAWKAELEKNLMLQGGGNVKKIDIEKVDSFEWKMGKVPVKVDSLIVKLEHVKGYRSSFRAIVDSSNGKILQTWDHPVNDNFGDNSKDSIKIDPSYHND